MSSIDSLIWTYLLTGASIGFGHCVGMCGPLVVSFSLHSGNQGRIMPHLLYHCGRILPYTILGAVMGATGSFTMVAAGIKPIQIGAMYLAGGLIITMGLAMGGWFPRIRIFDLDYCPDGLVTRMFGRLQGARSHWAYLPAGIALGFLPCGPVYTALLGAARAGMETAGLGQGVFTGMVMMAAFGLGTAPALLLVGKLTPARWLKFRNPIYKAGALLMIGMGVYFIVAAIRY